MRWNSGTLLGVYCLLCVVCGCGGDCDSEPRPTPGESPARVPDPAAARVDPQAIEIRPATAAEILRVVREAEAPAVLVNVWATWCIPCREELPDLLRLHRELADDGLAVMLVSADFESQLDAARAFLAAHGVDFPTYHKVGKDMEFIDTLDPRWSGSLPASWVFDARGERRHFWENKASYEFMRSRVLDVLRD